MPHTNGAQGRTRTEVKAAAADRKKADKTDRARYEELKRMLEERAREIHEKLRFLRETLPAEAAEVKDPEEQSLNEFVQGVDFALIQMKSQTLSQIDDALRRLEHGSYGLCAECGERIEEARLNALPFASLCRICQELEESRPPEEGGARLVGTVPGPPSDRGEESFGPTRAFRRMSSLSTGVLSWGFR